MTILHVGGIGFGRYKTLADAVNKSRRGDVIALHKNVKLESPIELKHDLTIRGEKPIWFYELEGYSALHTSEYIRLSLENINVEVTGQANFISAKNGMDVSLKNVTSRFKKGMDPRDAYPLIGGQVGQLSMELCQLDVFYAEAENVVMHGNRIGALYSTPSSIYAKTVSGITNTLTNVTIAAEIELERVTTDGLLSINGGGSLYGLTVRNEDVPKGKRISKDPSFVVEQMVGALFENGRYTVSNVVYEVGEQPIEGYLPVFVLNSDMDIDADMTLFHGDLSGSKDLSKVGSGESSAKADMDALIGLTQAKAQLEQFLASARVKREQEKRGLTVADDFSNHMVFAGPPGTGKTTVANILARALKEEGLLKTDNVIVANARDLVSKWVGDTAEKTHGVIESALGGVLIIDEAYSLLPRGEASHSREAVDQIVNDALLYKNDLLIILAGYADEMATFLDEANPGLRRRFSHWIEFEPYSFDDLLQILDYRFEKSGLTISEEAAEALVEKFEAFYDANVTENGLDGNGGFIDNLVRDLVANKNNRIAQMDLGLMSDSAINHITIADVEGVL